MRSRPRPIGAIDRNRIVLLWLCVFLLPALTKTAGAETYLHFESPPGEFVGAGETRTFTEADGVFSITGLAVGGLSIAANLIDAGYWSVNFRPPDGETLELGSYDLAASSAFPGAPFAKFQFAGDGRGCGSTSRAELLYVKYDAVSGMPTAAAIDFEQTCDLVGGTLTGSVRINAPPPPYPAAPDQDGDGIADRADNCIDIANPGQDDVDLDTIGDVCDPDPNRPTSFLVYNSVDDLVSQGSDVLISPSIANFINEKVPLESPFERIGEQITMAGVTSWRLKIWSPFGDPLIPGPYPNAWKSTATVPRRPGLSYAGGNIGCNIARGSFDILEIEYDAEGNLERLAVDFDQECSQNGIFFSEPLLGRIFFNSTGPPFAPYPDEDMDDWPDTIDNCIDVPNVDQSDMDQDGIGDACDPFEQQTWIDVDGTRGTYVAAGINDRFHSKMHLFDLQTNGPNDVIVEVYGVPHISLRFSADHGRELLVGPYGDADYFYSQRPGLDISVDARGCSMVGGRFDVLEIERAADDSITRFSVDATLTCFETDITEIQLRYNAADLIFPSPFDVDGDGVLDSRDNCRLDSNPSQADQDFDSIGDACDPEFNNTYFFAVGIPGSPPDLDDIYLISPEQAAFTVGTETEGEYDSIVATATAPGSGFRLTVTAPKGESIGVGHYDAELFFGFDRPPTSAYVRYAFGGSTCTAGAGSFDIHELVISPSGDIDRLALDFLHSCRSNGEIHHGFLRYDASLDYRSIEWLEPPPSYCAVGPGNPGPDDDADGILDVCKPVLVPEPDTILLNAIALITVLTIAAVRNRRRDCGFSTHWLSR